MIREFLTTVFPDLGSYWTYLWSPATKQQRESNDPHPDRRTWWMRDLDQMATFATALSNEGRDVYFGPAVAKDAGSTQQRVRHEEVVAVPGIWLDIDYGHSHKKLSLPPTIDDALSLLNETPMRPTICVATGGGLHAYWLYKELHTIATDVERTVVSIAARRWNDTFEVICSAKGWEIDQVADLPRVLRMPGTLNHKTDPPKPIEILWMDGPRWTEWDFDEHYLVPPRRKVETVPCGDIVITNHEPPWRKLGAHFENEPGLSASYYRKAKGGKDSSASGWDLSLATRLAVLGFTDQEIANTLRSSRRDAGQDMSKVDRLDYLQATITAARSTSAPHLATVRLGALQREEQEYRRELLDAGLPLPEPGSRVTYLESAKEGIQKALGLKVHRVIRWRSSVSNYTVCTELGDAVVGTSGDIAQQPKVRAALLDTTGHYIPHMTNLAWGRVVQAMLDISETTDLGIDSTDEGLIASWLAEYMDEYPTKSHEMSASAKGDYPVMGADGLVRIRVPNLRKWLILRNEQVDRRELCRLLRTYGAEEEKEEWIGKTGLRTRPVWRLPGVKKDALLQQSDTLGKMLLPGG